MPRPAVRRPPAAKGRAARPRGKVSVPSVLALAAFAVAWAALAVVRGVPAWATALYLGASALCFTLYAVDKQAAIAGRDRISESMLLSIGFVGGWPGAIVAQQVLRHKTSKLTFRIRFWLSVIANVAILAWVVTHDQAQARPASAVRIQAVPEPSAIASYASSLPRIARYA